MYCDTLMIVSVKLFRFLLYKNLLLSIIYCSAAIVRFCIVFSFFLPFLLLPLSFSYLAFEILGDGNFGSLHLVSELKVKREPWLCLRFTHQRQSQQHTRMSLESNNRYECVFVSEYKIVLYCVDWSIEWYIDSGQYE